MDDDSSNSSKPPPAPDTAGDVRICTWNVNSIKARMPVLSSYLNEKSPDVLLLQEIKTETEAFPFLELKGSGYASVVRGQKSYNGVAVLSKRPVETVRDSLPGAPDGGEQARYVETYCPDLKTLLISVYVPNGEAPESDPESTERLEYKLAWLDALGDRAGNLMRQDKPFVIGGDFNVIEYDDDVYDPARFKGGVFTAPSVRERFRAFYYTGLTNALRRMKHSAPLYSYWDYREGAWRKNNGILLDHLFLSPYWADRLKMAAVDTDVRGMEKTSDHAPVRCDLSLQ